MSPTVLLIDNYDSFVFNLARYLQELGMKTIVRRNDQLTIDEVLELAPAAIVLSPGPCTPNEAGICVELIRTLAGRIPLLGVCLGHQAIGVAYGGEVVRAPEPVHGRASLIHHDGTGLYQTCPAPLTVGRYHSLLINESTLPSCLTVTSRTQEGFIMGIAHKSIPVYGVQFHPESILTEFGHRLLANFLRLAGLSFQEDFESVETPDKPVDDDDFYRRAIATNAVTLFRAVQ